MAPWRRAGDTAQKEKAGPARKLATSRTPAKPFRELMTFNLGVSAIPRSHGAVG